MRISVVPDDVLAASQSRGHLGVLQHGATDLEEGRLDATVVEDLGDLRGVRLVGAVVEGQRDERFGRHPSVGEGPEQLRVRRHADPVRSGGPG